MPAPIPPQALPDDIFLVQPGKWTMVVVTHLEAGTLRFSELRRSIGGISQKILAGTLRELERDGVVNRTQYATIPPRVEYTLTEVGRDLAAFALVWREFVSTHYQGIEAARQRYDKKLKADIPHKFAAE